MAMLRITNVFHVAKNLDEVDNWKNISRQFMQNVKEIDE